MGPRGVAFFVPPNGLDRCCLAPLTAVPWLRNNPFQQTVRDSLHFNKAEKGRGGGREEGKEKRRNTLLLNRNRHPEYRVYIVLIRPIKREGGKVRSISRRGNNKKIVWWWLFGNDVI